MQIWIHSFVADTKVHIALLLVVVDFVLGISAALKLGTFRLSYIAAFAKTDLLEKLVPYFVIYAAALATNDSIVVGGFTFSTLADAVYALIVAAWVGSILNSLHELGFVALPAALAGSEHPKP
jgi:hypothetical protein